MPDMHGAPMKSTDPNVPGMLGAAPSSSMKPFPPHGCQGLAVIKACAALANGGRAVVHSACGTGKTESGGWVREALNISRCAVLVPTIALVKQTWERYESMGWTGRGLAVCSDPTTRDEGDMRVSEAGLTFVTTDVAEIVSVLDAGSCVIFCTYQSSPVLAEAIRLSGKPLDMVICDEAHRTAGRVERAFSTVLDDEKFPAARRLFLTATPRVFRDEGEGVASMDDVNIYGETVFSYPFGQAISDGILSDYDVAIVGVPHAAIRAALTAGQDAADTAAVYAMAKSLRKFDLRQVITFHSRVSRANQFSEAMARVIETMPESDRPLLPVHVTYMDGEMPMSVRGPMLAALAVEGQHNIIANVNCLAEGVDAPSLDGVGFIDRMISKERIVQAAGRGLRKHPSGKRATFVLPVYVGDDEDPEVVLSSSRHRAIWWVLQALREHDPRLGAVLRAAASGSAPAREGDAGPGPGLHLDLSPEMMAAMMPMLVFGGRAASNAETLKQIVASWPDRLSADQRGWVSTVRTNYRIGSVSQRIRTVLEGLVGWSWSGPRPFDAWVARFDRLRMAWPDRLTRADRAFVSECRRNHRKSSARRHTGRDQALESLAGWSWDSGWRPDMWETMYQSVLMSWPVLDEKQRRWTRSQKSAYDGIGGTRLDAERVVKLESLPGWAWYRKARGNVCLICGDPIDHMSAKALTCSKRCKNKHTRQKKRHRQKSMPTGGRMPESETGDGFDLLHDRIAPASGRLVSSAPVKPMPAATPTTRSSGG